MAKITIEYCSKYKSYNGEDVTEGKVLALVMISDEEFENNNTIILETLKTWNHFGVPFRVGFMVVDETDFDKMLSLYYGCINDYLDEHPQLRPSRCVLGWDSEGFPILCGKGNRCKDCPRRAEHLPHYKSREYFITFVSFQDTHETSYRKSNGSHKNTAYFLQDIEYRNGNYYTNKTIIDEIGQIEASGEDFSLLNKKIMSSRASTEGGASIVYRYSDNYGTKYIIHEVTDAYGYIIHRDFDAVRISSSQLINKEH